MKEYKIEFYSKLLNKNILKVVDDPKKYPHAIILEIREKSEAIDLQKEILKIFEAQTNIYRVMHGLEVKHENH
ncbi:MAG: hypothetical protein RR355_02135 [Oscillospiraceae bacterium]